MSLTPGDRSDFLDAHRRHWNDAELLYQRARWANADHLYGLSAECGLKAIMVHRGWVPVDQHGDPETPYRTHIDKLWDEFLTLANGRLESRYVVLLSPTNPFRDWRIGQRYAHETRIRVEMVKAHQRGAEEVRSLVSEARKDGLVG